MRRFHPARSWVVILSLWWLCAFIPAPQVRAAEYWVSSVVGNDANPGTVSRPWATLQFAADRVQPGDRVHVTGGDYAGFRLTRTGSAESRIVFRSMGAMIVSPNPFSPVGIDLAGVSNVQLLGFWLIGDDFGPDVRAGIRVRGGSGLNARARNITIRSTQIRRWRGVGIDAESTSGLVVLNTRVEDSPDGAAIQLSGSHERPVVAFNEVWDARDGIIVGAPREHAAGVGAAQDHSILDARISDNFLVRVGAVGGAAIQGLRLQDARLFNNVVYDSPGTALHLPSDGGVVESSRCAVYNNTLVGGAESGWLLRLEGAGAGHVVFNNVLFSASVASGSVLSSTSELAGLRSDHNIVSEPIGVFDADPQAITYLSLAQWTSQFGLDGGSALMGPAEFSAAFAWEQIRFVPRPGSLPIDRGVASFAGIPAPRCSRLQGPRPLGPGWDVGAYETTVLENGHHADGFEEPITCQAIALAN